MIPARFPASSRSEQHQIRISGALEKVVGPSREHDAFVFVDNGAVALLVVERSLTFQHDERMILI